jgi:NAD(P)-dependent dehydrogenase (short-subunit alcohol dehydrogenase family)
MEQGALTGRVTLVTGAATGIGRAIALSMSGAGASVGVGDISPRGQITADEIVGSGGKAAFVKCDVSVPGDAQKLVDQIAETFGAIDVLVNNAGISDTSRRIHEVGIEEWDRVLAVNLRGPFLVTRFAIPYLIASGHGVVINIASMFGITGAPVSGPYAASKGGLVNLTRQLAVDYGQDGVRVNAICPGYIDTDMGGRRAAYSPEQRQAANARRNAKAALQPLGRQASADEVAQVALFLASDASSFMTGAIVPVDGGGTATFNHGN